MLAHEPALNIKAVGGTMQPVSLFNVAVNKSTNASMLQKGPPYHCPWQCANPFRIAPNKLDQGALLVISVLSLDAARGGANQPRLTPITTNHAWHPSVTTS